MGLFLGHFCSLAITRLHRKLGLNLFPQTVPLSNSTQRFNPVSYVLLANRTIHGFPHLSFPNLSVSSPSAYCRNRSLAVLSGALLSGEAATARANERQRRRFLVAPAPISSKFHCPRPPWLVCTPDQNRHATQAKI